MKNMYNNLSLRGIVWTGNPELEGQKPCFGSGIDEIQAINDDGLILGYIKNRSIFIYGRSYAYKVYWLDGVAYSADVTDTLQPIEDKDLLKVINLLFSAKNKDIVKKSNGFTTYYKYTLHKA